VSPPDLAVRIEQVLAAHIPGYRALTRFERLSGGASQETWRIEIDSDTGPRLLAMRRAAGGRVDELNIGRPGLAGEARLMQCAIAAGVPAPSVHYVLTRGDDLGDGFIMSWIEGEALGARIVRRPEFAGLRPGLAYEIGGILARIHQIDIDANRLTEFLPTTPPQKFIQDTWDRYIALNTPQPMVDFTARWLLAHLPPPSKPVLVHNDFRTGNFMVSPERVVAIVDWETAHLGDPMRDLGWICNNAWRFGGDAPVGGFGQYEDLFRGYEEVSGRKIDPLVVRYWQVFGSFWWAGVCLHMVNQYRVGPDGSIERASIGRRASEALVDCVNLLIPGPVTLVTATPLDDLDMPRPDELIEAISLFLRQDVMSETTGRTQFLARVSANSLDIVKREMTLLPAHRANERVGLAALFGTDDTLVNLRWRLVHALRDGSQPIEDEALTTLLRQTIVNQVAIDQPKYSGLKQALDRD
jgi:aminoglycoside phosphotransferase (APT) family kinase protein